MIYVGYPEYDEQIDLNQLVIYGAGHFARRVLQYLEYNNLHNNIICFCVSEHEQLIDKELKKFQIRNISDISKEYVNAHYIIAGKYFKNMLEQCEKFGLKNVHIWLI